MTNAERAEASLPRPVAFSAPRPKTPRGAPFQVVEGKGFEPSTSALRTPRSPN